MKELITNKKYGDTFHFEMVEHYGDLKEYEKVKIDKKHNGEFIQLVDKIIEGLEKQLEDL